MTNYPLVAIIDDDESVRESLPDLLRLLDYSVQSFSSAELFLASDCVDEVGCIILDIVMPGMSGPDLVRELGVRAKATPIIFVTAQAHVDLRGRMFELGAVMCLFKPFSEADLIAALELALPRTTATAPRGNEE